MKHGFATMPQLTDEFGTARNCNITASKVCLHYFGRLSFIKCFFFTILEIYINSVTSGFTYSHRFKQKPVFLQGIVIH